MITNPLYSQKVSQSERHLHTHRIILMFQYAQINNIGNHLFIFGQISTVEDILKHNLTIGLTEQSIDYFRMEQYSSDRIAAEILERYVLCEEATACLNRVAQSK